MLHPTNLPDCESILQRLLDFQERLLEYACKHTDILQPDLELTFGKELADWLYVNRQLMLDPLKRFAKLPQIEKDAVLTAYRHDRQYPAGKDDPTFTFLLRVDGTSPQACKDVKDWLVGSYKQFAEKIGFHPGCWAGAGTEHFHKRHWHQSYLERNPKQHTCVACDSTLNQGRTVEHYFPKAKYPVLSVHPHNLIPLCGKCNHDKGEKDVLGGAAITEVFLPYHRFFSPVAHLAFSSMPSGIEEVALKPSSPAPEIPKQIARFSDLFGLPKRWQDNFHEIQEIAKQQLRTHMRAWRDAGKTVDKATLPSLIEKTCEYMKEDWGQFNYFYPATEWLNWAKDNKFESLCAELLTGP